MRIQRIIINAYNYEEIEFRMLMITAFVAPPAHITFLFGCHFNEDIQTLNEYIQAFPDKFSLMNFVLSN